MRKIKNAEEMMKNCRGIVTFGLAPSESDCLFYEVYFNYIVHLLSATPGSESFTLKGCGNLP